MLSELFIFYSLLFSLFNTTDAKFKLWNTPSVNTSHLSLLEIPISFNDEISVLYGDGHFEYLKEVFGHFSKNKNPHDIVFNFCANSIIKHMKNGVFDHRTYFEKTFLKNVDIWGFLSIYMSILLIKTKNLGKIKKNIENLLFKHLFNNYTTIDIQDLYFI